jgi:hypothetical protein
MKMNQIIYLNKDNVKGMKLVGFKENNLKGECGCALCGKGLKNVYIISNGSEFANVGSECVKTIAEMQNKNTMDGITKIPAKHRKAIKINKVELSDDELPF